MKPLIAVTPEAVRSKRPDGLVSHCQVRYTDAVALAGGVPVILPLTRDPAVLDRYLQTVQGLLLTGGGDMADPAYSAPLTDAERATLGGVEPVRDEMEIYLARRALAEDRPLLGICRGIQVLNVAAGGSLMPDIALRRPGALAHRSRRRWAHPVDWDSRGRWTGVLGPGFERVNSTHHQAVDRVAPGFAAIARAPDGIVEAIEKPGARFVAGVQFHPERLLETAPQFRRLFEVFVESCRDPARHHSITPSLHHSKAV